MNFYNLANSVQSHPIPVFGDCVAQFGLMFGSETLFQSGPGTSASCSQSCEEMPMSPNTQNGCETSASCSQSCEEMPVSPNTENGCETSASCSQSCAEMAASPMTGYICDLDPTGPVTANCTEEGCITLALTSKNKNFAAPPQFQSTSTAYQAAPAFLC